MFVSLSIVCFWWLFNFSPTPSKPEEQKTSNIEKMTADQKQQMLLEQGFNPILPAYKVPDSNFDFFINRHAKGIPQSIHNYLKRGQPLIIHLMESWCGPCKKELPHLLKFAQTLKDANVIIMVSNRSNMNEIWQLYEDSLLPTVENNAKKILNKNVGIAFDQNGSFGKKMRVGSIPTTFFVNKKGMLIGMAIGIFEWHNETLMQVLLEKLHK